MKLINLLRFYLALIKTPQTALLIFTALAGYQSGEGNLTLLQGVLAFTGILLAISGTTALNMVFDRDIDAVMERTKQRPIPTRTITPRAALIFGSTLIVAGMIINYQVSMLYANIVLAGVGFDFIIYTIWLKRRSPWSIIFGGLAGGMPIMAGRALATGQIDFLSFLMATAILLWIPTHILTLAMNHSKDYSLAGVPTFPNVFGFEKARYFIAGSNLTAAVIIVAIFIQLSISISGIALMVIGNLILLVLSYRIIRHPSLKMNFTMFKFASLYMAVAMLILVI
ncbi:MAG: protoheme IX farnesyltransferase [Candidatus Marinimicrobia bacterium]|nr:protoheme IX farnesyltransferase [Candidatus Neomarinimicrobiota bacterium]